jgi:hypothetical protein
MIHKEIRSLLSLWFSGAWKINRGHYGNFKPFPCFLIGLSDAFEKQPCLIADKKSSSLSSHWLSIAWEIWLAG